MRKSEEVWIGPATDKEMEGLESWSGREFGKVRKARVCRDESWIVLDGAEIEWSTLHLRRHEFEVVGSFSDVQRHEASRRLQELEWRGLDAGFREAIGSGILKGSRSAWMSRAALCDGFESVEFEKRFATPFEVDAEPMRSIVGKVEEERSVIVYHMIWEVRKGVELYELLHVSPCIDSWVRERDSVACGWADALIVNPAEADEEVMAKIGIEVAEGCLLRRWPKERESAVRKAAMAAGKIGQRAAAAANGLLQQP